jgi:hypothetical protein
MANERRDRAWARAAGIGYEHEDMKKEVDA